MDADRIRIFRICAGLSTGLIRAPVYDEQGRPARQRWMPPWSDERDRFDDPTEFVLFEVRAIQGQYRRMKMGIPFVGGGLLRGSQGLMHYDDSIMWAKCQMDEPTPEIGGFSGE